MSNNEVCTLLQNSTIFPKIYFWHIYESKKPPKLIYQISTDQGWFNFTKIKESNFQAKIGLFKQCVNMTGTKKGDKNINCKVRRCLLLKYRFLVQVSKSAATAHIICLLHPHKKCSKKFLFIKSSLGQKKKVQQQLFNLLKNGSFVLVIFNPCTLVYAIVFHAKSRGFVLSS